MPLEGIEEIRKGSRIGDISYAIQSWAEKNNFSVVRELVGHGIGSELHEYPEIPNYGRKGTGPRIENGLALAIEPMINMGSKDVIISDDNWTVKTRDNSYSAHYEHTVSYYNDQVKVLTSFDYIEKEFLSL